MPCSTMIGNHNLTRIGIVPKVIKLVLSISVICLLGFSFLLIPINAADLYAYVTASPNQVQKGQTSTLTLTGYIYGDGKYDISVEFWESNQFDDRHQNTNAPDQSVGSCTTSVTVTKAGTFKCSHDIVPSKYSEGNIEEEGDWTEYYATVKINNSESYKTSDLTLIYCTYCSR